MKKLLFIILLFSTLLSAQAQEKKKLTKEERKEVKQKEAEQQKALVDLMVEYRRFVLEATSLKSKKGVSVQVNSNINFIIIDSTEAVFQLGSAHTVGYNGVGGATIKGRVTNYEVTKREKSESYSIRVNIMSNIGQYEIWFSISSNGNADATVNAHTSARLNYTGRVEPIATSRVYQGISF